MRSGRPPTLWWLLIVVPVIERIRCSRGIWCPGRAIYVFDFRCFFVEYLDEVGTDNLAFALGLCNACEVGKESGRSVDAAHVEAEAFVVAENRLEFVLTQHAVVDKYTCETVADSLVEQNGSHRRVNAAAETEYYLVVAELLAQFGHGAFDEAFGAPRAVGTAYAHGEVAQQSHAAFAMVYLGVELYAVDLASVFGHVCCVAYLGVDATQRPVVG